MFRWHTFGYASMRRPHGIREPRTELSFKKRALHDAANVPFFKCHYAVLANLNRTDGDLQRAHKEIALCEEIAHDVNGAWALYESTRRKAHLLWGEIRQGAILASQAALALCIDNSWTDRARRLRMEFPHVA